MRFYDQFRTREIFLEEGNAPSPCMGTSLYVPMHDDADESLFMLYPDDQLGIFT